MTSAFTVSKMLATINEAMAPVATDTCASVSLQRKMDNGVMLDTSEKEIAYLDMKAKIKHAAQQVAPLGRRERFEWIRQQRASAKDAFTCREYERAAECYMQALAALDFGETDADKRETQQQAQLPLTCNLAACMLMMAQWDKAKRICDQALALDPCHVRALQQRAKALAKLHQFAGARADIALAKSTAERDGDGAGGQQAAQLDRQLVDVARAEARHKRSLQQQRAFQKNMMVQAAGKLYAEKEDVKPEEERASGLVSRLRAWIAALVGRAVGSALTALRSLARAAGQPKHIKAA